MDNVNNKEFDTVFVQQLDRKSNWTCTPFFFFCYYLIFVAGYLSFTIANGVALFYETGIWQVPAPVLEYSGKSHTWYSNYSFNNSCASSLHLLSCSTMIYYENIKTYDRKAVLLFGLFCFYEIYSAIKEQILGVARFTTEMLETSEGISLMEDIFVGIFSVQIFFTVILLCVRFILGVSIIKLPETHSNYQQAAYFLLPIALPLVIQYYLYDTFSLSIPELQLILVGILAVFLVHWERNQGS